LIILCILVLGGVRFLSPEDTRICEGTTLVKHGNPSSDGSGFFSFWKKNQDVTCLSGKLTQSFLPIQPISMDISTDFMDNGLMPSMYTCDGEWYFPSLHVGELPKETKSLALIVDDPDAPAGVRNHLLLANIPLPVEDALIISQDTFDQWILWENSWWEQARWAPCPPSGTHRYTFKLYALSEMLDLSSWFSKERLLEMMWGKILWQAQIVGLYKR